MKKGLLLVILCLVLTSFQETAWARIKQEWTWSPPADGSTPVSYIVEVQLLDEEWELVEVVTECRIIVKHPRGQSRIRVAAIAADGSQGPWSEPSDWFVDIPTRPNKPGWRRLP
jgi:hypothetical protein